MNFCYKNDARKLNRRNIDHCRNNFRYKLKARLVIKDKKDCAKKTEQLFKELNELIVDYPLGAFEKLKSNNEILYRNRSRKIRNE